jgi:hypothetical protein
MASRKNFPERVETRRLSAAARGGQLNEAKSARAQAETEPSKQPDIETKKESRPINRDYKMYVLFLLTALIVTITRQVSGKISPSGDTISYFCELYFIDSAGLGFVWVWSTVTIAIFHDYFLGSAYQDRKPEVNDAKPIFFYFLVFAIVLSIVVMLGANAGVSDWDP